MMPLIIAHRGSSAHAPENTLPAFQLALDQAADGIELDVMLSKDQELIVIHDSNLERTTNGTGKVNESLSSELKKLDAGVWFGEGFKNTRLPLLSEVYDLIGDKMLINVELKNYHNPKDNLAELALTLTKEHKLIDSVLFSSFNAFNLTRLKKLDPHAKTGLLCLPGKSGAPFRGLIGRLFKYDALHPYYKDTSPQLLKTSHQRKKQFNVWTVNEVADLQRMAALGVDAIITDDPQHARHVLKE